MNFQLKNLVLPTLLTVLAGCDSSSSNTANTSNNSAPVLSSPEVFETEYSTYAEVYDISTDQNVMQVQYTFQESDTFENGAKHFDIDLLKGFTDPDEGQLLTVDNFQYVWVGPDCSDTIVAAANYPEICEPILTPLGYEVGQTDIDFEDKQIIKKAQNYPITDEIMYGFKIKQSVLTVTPTEFAPILFQDEVSVVNISFDISDGITSVKHYILAKIVGKNSAPQFLELNPDGSPSLVNEETVPVIPEPVTVSEKGDKVTINLLEGVFDQDIYNNQVFARQVGDLDNYYTYHNDNSYSVEKLGVQGVTANITYDGVTAPAGSFTTTNAINDPITGDMTGFELTFDPSVFADQLEKGEEGTITYNFFVTDGNADNKTARTATFIVKGANLFNAPEFTADLVKTISAHDDMITFDLLEGVLDADGDPMEVIDLVTPVEAQQFGITVNNDGTISVDPYGFLYLSEDQSEKFSFTYKVTDGTLTSEERTFELNIAPADVNLVRDGTFESGAFDNGWVQQTGGPDGTVLNANGAFSGSFGVTTLVDNSAVRLTAPGIIPGKITEDDNFYVTWQTKTSDSTVPYANVTLLVKNPVDNSNIYPAEYSTMRGVRSQVLHTVDFLKDNFFTDPAKEIALQFSGLKDTTLDDVRMVPYRFNQQRNLVKGANGHFNDGTAPDWVMSTNDATIALTEDANRYGNDIETLYGLEAKSTASWTAIRLMPEGIKQGTFKKGIRYVVEFDFKNVNGPEAIEVKLIDQTSGNYLASPKNRISQSTTLWQNLRFHFVTDTESTYFNGAIASDPDFDWSLADDVRLEIIMKDNATFNIDNVRLYPVPE
ncbi:Ig-like domain-containing protein [Thalassotalea agariperforans]